VLTFAFSASVNAFKMASRFFAIAASSMSITPATFVANADLNKLVAFEGPRAIYIR
jgi:hypothetical protein